ncbi:MAG: hypothetical protein HLX51_01520 [Micrococcaceae bacterium]|nr:hypothetical protein [Micrococcaceae bacterium]
MPQTKAAQTSVIPNRHEPSPLYTKIFGSMWARGTLIAVSAAASAFILLSRIMPEHDWLMVMAIICTFVTAVGTALTMVADHASKKRLDSERRRGVRDAVTSWKPRFEDAIEFDVEIGEKQTIVAFRNRILETVYNTVRDLGDFEPRVCLYQQENAEAHDPTLREQAATSQEGIIYVAHHPRTTRLRPRNRTFQRNSENASGMFECFDKMVATSETNRKEFKSGINRWRAAVRVPIVVEDPETGDEKAWGIITVDSLEPSWPNDPTYSEVLEFAAMLLSISATAMDNLNKSGTAEDIADAMLALTGEASQYLDTEDEGQGGNHGDTPNHSRNIPD